LYWAPHSATLQCTPALLILPDAAMSCPSCFGCKCSLCKLYWLTGYQVTFMQIAANRHNTIWHYNCVINGDCIVEVIRRGSGDADTIAAYENEVTAYGKLRQGGVEGKVVPILYNSGYIV
jgi:hypothetical protein